MIKVLAVAIASLSALVGFADAANVHPNNVLLKQDGGTAAAGVGAATWPDYPWRMSRKGLKDNMVKGGGKVPKHEDSPQDVGAQIVGGEEVNPPRKYKFFVWLNGCGGSLIAPDVVLTAAHCFEGSTPGVIYTNPGIQVKLGMHKIALAANETKEFDHVEIIPMAAYVIHPDYNDMITDYDFALIQLEWASKLYANEVVVLHSPSDDSELTPDDDLVVFGFGMLSSVNETFPNVMQEVTINYISNEACANAFEGVYEITSSMLCAKREGKGGCFGDSGGPILNVATQKQVGVVSWGDIPCGDYPTVFSRVSAAYDDFILPYIARMSDKFYDLLNCFDNSFYDSKGFDCVDYANTPDACGEIADNNANAGVTANEACCTCGGGTNEKRPSSKPSISSNPSASSKPSGIPSVSSIPSDSSKPSTCNTAGWVDADGDGCDWYEENELPGCPLYGDCCDGGMGVANNNCCFCAGTGAPTQAPVFAGDDSYSLDNNGQISEQLFVLSNDITDPPGLPLIVYEITEDPSLGACIISNLYGHPLAIQYIPPANTSAVIKSVSCRYRACTEDMFCDTARVSLSFGKVGKAGKQSKALKNTNSEGGSSVYGNRIEGVEFESFSMIESMSIGESLK